jgi:hypothetical protein
MLLLPSGHNLFEACGKVTVSRLELYVYRAALAELGGNNSPFQPDSANTLSSRRFCCRYARRKAQDLRHTLLSHLRNINQDSRRLLYLYHDDRTTRSTFNPLGDGNWLLLHDRYRLDYSCLKCLRPTCLRRRRSWYGYPLNRSSSSNRRLSRSHNLHLSLLNNTLSKRVRPAIDNAVTPLGLPESGLKELMKATWVVGFHRVCLCAASFAVALFMQDVSGNMTRHVAVRLENERSALANVERLKKQKR